MDKRKQETLKEVRKRIGLQLQDRRNFLNIILNLENSEKSIELQDEHIVQMQAELVSNLITERDRFGNTLTKNQLKREIESSIFNLKMMKLNLDYNKEDIYFKLHGKEGLLDKADGKIENLKKQIESHFALMREEYKKLKEKLGD